MTFSQRVAAVMARVVAENPDVRWSDASREWDAHHAPPCILWKRTAASPAQAAQLHDRANAMQRAILGKAQGFVVKIWGGAWPQVDDLFAALVRALEAEASGAWSYQGDAPSEVGQLTAGESILVSITLRAHVAEADPATVVITSARVRRSTAAASGDGSIEPGDP